MTKFNVLKIKIKTYSKKTVLMNLQFSLMQSTYSFSMKKSPHIFVFNELPVVH